MYDMDTVPYFPFNPQQQQDVWILENPLDGRIHKLNQSAFWLLQLCDGYRTFGEILEIVEDGYSIGIDQALIHAQPLLEQISTLGLLWWRRQRMHWWRLPPPNYVLWELTAACNLLCRHCVVGSGPAVATDDELTLEECKQIIDQMADFGVQQVILSGGEPLMRRDFFEIADYASASGLALQVATNATLMTKEKAVHLSKIDATAQVSLDGATPEVHDDFRQCPRSWQRAVRGITYLVDAGVPVMVASTVTNANVDQIPALCDLAENLGAATFRILPFVPYGRGTEAKDLEISPSSMREVTQYLHDRREKNGIAIAPMEFECTLSPPTGLRTDSQAHVGCDGAYVYCTILPNGEVLPCSFFAGVQTENLRDYTFSQIWETSRFLNYFRSLTVTDIHGTCHSCSWFPECRGSCIAANFAHKDIFQSNCHCWYVKP